MQTNALLASLATKLSRRIRHWPRWIGLPLHRLLHRLTGLGRRFQPALPMKKVESKVLPIPAELIPASPVVAPDCQIIRWSDVIQERVFYLDFSPSETAADFWPMPGFSAHQKVVDAQHQLLRKRFPHGPTGALVACHLLVLEKELTDEEIVLWLRSRNSLPATPLQLLKFLFFYGEKCSLNGRFFALGEVCEGDIVGVYRNSVKKMLHLFFFWTGPKVKRLAGDIILAIAA